MIKKIKDSAKIAALVLLCLCSYSRHVHNELIDEEHLLHIAHGRLEVEMQQRHDIVTRCRSAVERYRGAEEKIQERLIALNGLSKSRGNNAAKLKEKNEILALLKELDLLAEQYPALKSKGPYAHLMEIIQESGLRVNRERLNYNERIYEYNVMCRIFPYGIFARIFGFKEEPFLKGPHHNADI